MKKFGIILMIVTAIVCMGILISCTGTADNEPTPGASTEPTAVATPTQSPLPPAPTEVVGEHAPTPGPRVLDKVETIVVPEDNSNSEKVITEKKFETPANFTTGNAFRISAIYSSNMVLQAYMNDRIFGYYSGTGSFVAAKLTNDETKDSRTFYGEVGAEGYFEIWLGSTPYGGPYTLVIFDEAGVSVTYTNILFGEVWVLGGQSNMGWALGQCYDGTVNKNLYTDYVNEHGSDLVRWMGVWPVSSKEPVEMLDSIRAWNSSESGDVYSWSATGYFFATRLHEIYNIPVGVVSANMGATSVADWRTTGSWYKGVANPVKKMTVRGVCWYQGEGDHSGYADRLTELINEWRSEFENPNLYWAAVEMPRYYNEQPYYLCREEVKSLYGKLDKYTYCVTIDTGLLPEWKATGDELNGDGIHPYEKLKVGERLADACAYDFYGATGTWTCPQISKVEVVNGEVLLTFDNVGDGLVLRGLLNGFQVAGTNRKYKEAVPELVGKNQVLLHCEEVTTPWGVRYGYKNYKDEGCVSCSDSVCLYSTVCGGYLGYPAEQFTVTKINQ